MNKAINPVVAMGIQSRIDLALTIIEAEQRLALAQETIKQAQEAVGELDKYFGEDEHYKDVKHIFSGTPEEFFNYLRDYALKLLDVFIKNNEDDPTGGLVANWKSTQEQLKQMTYSEEEFAQRSTWQHIAGLMHNLKVHAVTEEMRILDMFAQRCHILSSSVSRGFYAGATDFSRGNLNPMNNRMTRMMGGRNPNGPMMPGGPMGGNYGPMHSNFDPLGNNRF